jgi:hypothetical protein
MRIERLDLLEQCLLVDVDDHIRRRRRVHVDLRSRSRNHLAAILLNLLPIILDSLIDR